MKKWSSHAVKAPEQISHEISHPMGHDRRFDIARCCGEEVTDLLVDSPSTKR